MPVWKKIAVVSVCTVGGIGLTFMGIFYAVSELAVSDPFITVFEDNCSVCHGDDMRGTTLGPALVGAELAHGESVDELSNSIANGFPQRGMPAWTGGLDDGTVRSLAILIAERRVDRTFADFKVDSEVVIPTEVISSQLHDFSIEVFATGLDPLPFSIEPLPDGGFLLTEKTQGVSIISPSGEQSELVSGAPHAYDDGVDFILEMGLGWNLDIKLHPDYAENGWVYLHFTDRCGECAVNSTLPVTMNKLVRGRIEDGAWVDEELIWQADARAYTSMPDLGAGGRLAFDEDGFVYMSIGIKGTSNFHGMQNLGLPYGKIMRVHDDGRTPTDNPFVDDPKALPSIWTYGHRSPQGLEWNKQTSTLWGTEMGPRGGDELNLLRPGRNFGWPLYSKGLDYDGTRVEYGKDLGIEFDLEDIEQPVVDFTPSPAISSFIFYEADRFASWRNNALVGSLKATELYRLVFDGNKVVHMETLIKGLARIRDIETGADGNVYLLLEHKQGGMIVRLVPQE
jgi:glucose/arabinose dehydrogenase